MKYIQKGEEPPSFSAWKALENESWIPTYKNLQGQEKIDLYEALLVDQGFICCYCGVQVNQKNSHIEHLPAQSFFRHDPSGAINYQHLLVSCGISDKWLKEEYQQEWTEEKFEDLLSCSNRCGIKRGDEPISISPLQPDCEAFFVYDISNGAIETWGTSDQQNAASATIVTLNLDAQKLRNLRKAAIDTAILISEELTEEEIVRFFKEKNQRGEFIPFCSAIVYVLKI